MLSMKAEVGNVYSRAITHTGDVLITREYAVPSLHGKQILQCVFFWSSGRLDGLVDSFPSGGMRTSLGTNAMMKGVQLEDG